MLQAIDLECVRGERCLFQGLDIELGPGQCLHIAGDNGAGKTSLLRILAGLLSPTKGKVRWRGRDITRTREEYGSELAFVGHLNGIKDDLTVLENVRLEAAVRGVDVSVDVAREALARLGLEEFDEVLVRHLSQGQKRRVALARLCGAVPTRLWILDEPFNALDSRAVETVYALLEAHLATGGIAVLTAHQKVDLPASAQRLDLLGWALA
ncbi:MAG TPA: cytochrome c biogenesis heme-transporting ATPase CcmA [Burkholderiaceae bacterium]|nr:cytochrome c biogenesis heme-transporting ATPase CcmA [Burkholderiaceae bacterium]